MTSSSDSRPLSVERDAALGWLYGRINYEHRMPVPYAASQFRLDRMRRLLDRLGRPDAELKIIHVAGTKGKGSTSAMLVSVLTGAGYRTGLFSSPHLDRVEERIAIDGRPCSAEEFVRLIAEITPVVESMDREAASNATEPGRGPTYFEILTALGLIHFHQQQVDLVILEVGLGGRLDSTNVCTPILSVLTGISIDHTEQLGTSLASIAREKAGIIKPGIPVVSGETQAEPQRVIRQVADACQSHLIEMGRDFRYRYRPSARLTGNGSRSEVDVETMPAGSRDRQRTHHDLELGLLGRHQAVNCAVAVAVCEELERQGWAIPRRAIRNGLAHVDLPARVEVMGENPTVLVDAAHNVSSAQALAQVLEQCRVQPPRMLVFAVSRDKDARGMLEVLGPYFEQIVLTRYRTNPRAVDLQELSSLAVSVTQADCRACDTPERAWEHVRRTADPDHTVVVAGSFFLAAEMRRLIIADPCQPAAEPFACDAGPQRG